MISICTCQPRRSSSQTLDLIRTHLYHSATRQACSVWLKNRVQAGFALDPAKRRPDQAPIATSDRDALKATILPLLAASPSRSISVQLASTFKTAVSDDYPEKWPGLLEKVKQMLTSGEIREVHAGCVAALECVRAFRRVLLANCEGYVNPNPL